VSEPRSRQPEKGAVPAVRGTVLFVHGLWLTGAESFLLRRQLARHGWALRVFSYSSMTEPMDAVASRCARQALQLAQRAEGPVHLLAHSLGGIVVYRMFETGLLEPDRFSGDFCRVVFMGTPARGSRSARMLAKHGAASRLLGQVGARDLLEGLPASWPFAAQLGILAGDKPRGLGRMLTHFNEPNDGTVCVTETCLDGSTDNCVLPVSHTGVLLSSEVARQVVAFFEAGRFAPLRT
jgi:pimeloyl-ACP methyl ester carboxylesterase